MKTIKEFTIKRGTISEGLKKEIYLLKEDVVKLIDEGCEKELMTSRTERDDVVLCGDTYNEEICLCSHCKRLKARIEG